jgi:hypothetical protein
MMTVVTNIPDLIKALGGHQTVAKWAGYEDCRGVHNWVTRGIPPAYHLRLALKGYAHGVVIEPDVFGLEPAEGRLLREVLAARAG